MKKCGTKYYQYFVEGEDEKKIINTLKSDMEIIKAGKVPVTLVSDEITDGFLLNQKKLHIEFCNVDEMFVEIEKLLNNKKILKDKKRNV